MAVNPEALQAIFDRIEAGKHLGQQDLQILVKAVRSKQVTIGTGDRAVTIGGSADGAVIVTGDRNVIIAEADAEAIRELIGKRPRTERLLLQAVRDEITSRLKQSLHKAVLIQLGMKTQPEQVKRPWDSDIKIGNKPSKPIPEGWNILQVFDEAQGKLLILGAPGSGKTTMMLELARELCGRAEKDAQYPIPILLNLSNWKDDELSIQNWIIVELETKYGVRKDLGTYWINNQNLLPMLDGLDELESHRQDRCSQKLDQLLQSNVRPQYLVVCSRYEEYSNYTTKLELNGAICLKELRILQIQEYLERIEYSELWGFLEQNSTLLKLIKTPLFLNILILSIQKFSIKNWQEISSTSEQKDYLLHAYIQQMLARSLPHHASYRRESLPTKKQTKRWLAYLAKQLQKETQTEFSIGKMQPRWLVKKREKYLYRIITGTFFGLYGGLIILIIIWFNFKIVIGSYYALVFSLIIGLFFALGFGTWAFLTIGYAQDIQLIENLKVSPLSLTHSLLGGLIAGVITWQLSKMIVFLMIGLIIGIVYGVQNSLIQNIRYFNQGIHLSLKNAIYLTIFTGLIFSCFAFVMQSQISFILFGNSKILPLSSLLISSILLGGFFGLLRSGTAIIQHLSLRIVLTLCNYCSWNYARFLDYATERMLLQRVGGRYRFIHQLLQEHFAAMPFEEK